MEPENDRKVPRRPAAVVASVAEKQDKNLCSSTVTDRSIDQAMPRSLTTQRSVRIEVGGAKVERLERAPEVAREEGRAP